MYNEASIQVLLERIGWHPAIEPTDIVLTAENVVSTSGRFFNGFNPLAIVENVNASITNKDATNDTLNEVLATLKTEGVLDVLSKVYNLNTRATAAVTNFVTSLNYASDYSDSIIANQQAFDDAIGLSVAIKTLEMLRTTNRSNDRTNNPKIDIGTINEYFYGAVTNEGHVLARGLIARYGEVIGDLIDVLFPVVYPEGSEITTDSNGNSTVKVKKPAVLRAYIGW